MKNVFTGVVVLSLILSFCPYWAQAQLSEGFDNPTNLCPPETDGEIINGWMGALRSDSIGSTGIFNFGTPALGEFEGGNFSLVGMNFNNSLLGADDVTSTWLMSPEVTLNNGDNISFYAISADSTFPDRLLVRLSTNGASVDVGTGPLDVGDFGTVILDINPDYQEGVFIREWVKYEATVKGLSGPTQGRIALHYFNLFMNVNGDSIQIDSFEFSGGKLLLGDVNCDGVVDLLDVSPFVDAITTGTFSAKADLNEDGSVDLLDVAPFITLLLGG